MKWALKVKSTPFGTEEPFVKPFGEHKGEKKHYEEKEHHCHWKTSSPMASPCQKGSYIQMKGGSKK